VFFAIYSEPVLLGSAIAGPDGVARLAVNLPAGLPLGAHTVVSFGTSPGGAERVLVQSVNVSEPVPAAAPAALPRTGGGTGQLALAGAALIAAGGLVLVGRRRGVLGG
jgi:LPXTG-motif cell wall-anchored protein